MMGPFTSVTLQSLLSSDDETRGWLAMARTPETRARIRRWATIETLGMLILLVGGALCCLAVLATIAVGIWSIAGNVDRPHLYWWIWGVALGVLTCGLAALLVATRQRQTACFADGRVAVGAVERAIELPGGGDDHESWDLRISALLPDGTVLRRRVHLEGGRLDRCVGSRVRFRHNTLDADAFDDVLLVDRPNKRGQRPGRKESS